MRRSMPEPSPVPLAILVLSLLWTMTGGGMSGGVAARTVATPPPGAASTTSAPTSPVATPPAGDAWGPVTLAADAPVQLSVPGSWPDGIPLRPTLVLRRLDGGSARDAAAGLVAEPPVSLRVRDAQADRVTLEPERPLERDTAYRFSATDPDGRQLGSWSFRTLPPPMLVSVLPREDGVDVPLTTVIELTFNQAGVADPSPWWSIVPAAPGRFETHGRAAVFVPDRPLLPGTRYTFRIAAGLPVPATGMALEDDVVGSFMTRRRAMTGPEPPSDWGGFPRRVVETRPGARASLAYDVTLGGIRRIWVQVHRLPDAASAIAAIRALTGIGTQPDPAPVATARLPRVVAATVRLVAPDHDFWTERTFQLPTRLPAGWYVVTVHDGPGSADQAIVQSTELAAYAQLSWTRSAVWVNDLATGRPVAGAGVRLLGGPRLGTTGQDGLLLAATPAEALAEDAWPVLVIRHRERVLVVPFGVGGWESDDRLEPVSSAEIRSGRFWSILTTDRTVYRSTDTIDAWGLVKDRDTGQVPASVTVALSDGDPMDARPIWTTTVHPTAAGAFTAQIRLTDLPEGGYDLEVLVDGSVVRSSTIWVATIRKPTYQLSLAPAHRILVSGEPITVTATASFFDGTPAPGIPLWLGFGEDEAPVRAVTDVRGEARATLVTPPVEWDQWSMTSIDLTPARGEEGDNVSSTGVVVFNSAALLDGEGTIVGRQGRVRATLVALDRVPLEPVWQTAWDWRTRDLGTPVAGGAVHAAVIETRWVQRQTGTHYDPVTKQAVPTYELEEREATTLEQDLVTDGRGAVDLAFRAVRDREYRVVLTTSDPDGRRTTAEVYVDRAEDVVADEPGVTLDATWPGGPRLAIGGRATVRLLGAGRPMPRDAGRYLWLTSQRGLRSATVGGSPVHEVTMHPADAPLLSIVGVRFTGSGYLSARGSATIEVDPASRALTVTLAPSQERYEPGGTAQLDVRVRDARGRPVAADVVVRAIDEKLFTMGIAELDDPLETLYAPVPDGTFGTYSTHRPPSRLHGDGKGDGGGSDELRSDFRDQILFRLVHTGTDGHAIVRFDLSDDLTTWRLLASAVTERLQAGAGHARLAVGLPFFVEAIMATDLLVGDRPGVRVRAYGSGLQADEAVTVTVSAPTLGMRPTSVRALAFREVVVPLPAMVAGRHAVTVTARTDREPVLTDGVVRTVTVSASRLTQVRRTWTALDRPVTPAAGTGWTGYLVTDAGRGAAVPVLLDLAWQETDRADAIIAAAEARRRLVEGLGVDPAMLPEGLGASAVQPPGGGIALLPYGPADLELSTMVALVAPDAVDREALAGFFSGWGEEDEGWEDEECWDEDCDEGDGDPGVEGPDAAPADADLMLLAGRAATGGDVTAELRAAARERDLDVAQLLWVGLGAAAAGDQELARAIERTILERHGEQALPYLRIRGRDGHPDALLTARTGLLAAWLGDLAVADACEQDLALERPEDTLVVLERLGMAVQRAAHLPAGPGRFAVTVGDQREVVDLEPGGTWFRALLPSQAAGIRFEPVAGSLSLAVSSVESVDPAAVGPDPGIRVTREVTPTGRIDPAQLVEVRLRVVMAADVLPGCYLVRETVPSGMVPVMALEAWDDEDGDWDEDEDALPWWIEGQAVTWCVEQGTQPAVLRYEARVVAPGTYRWEPTLVQSGGAPDVRTFAPPETAVELG